MARLLLIGLLILALVSGGLYFLAQRNTPKIVSAAPSPSPTIKFASSSAYLEDRFQSIEDAITLLDKNVAQSQNPELVQRVNKLETDVASLKTQVSSLPTGSSPTPSPPPAIKKSPLYIPLGWVGDSTGMDWTSIPSQTISINGSDYSGYTSMQFEASIAVYQGNGQTFARIINQSDNAIIFQSEISATSQNYTWVSSGNFTIPNSQKTFVLQLKSLTGYNAQIQNARIKVNF
jgi:hypothetical protein